MPPLLYSLLSDKTKSTYVFMLNVLKSLLCDIECGIIMLDFEKASMYAFTQVFDQFSLMNCFFHLCQSVQRRIQKSFKVKYRTDKDFALASRLVVFLAFVPPEHTETAFKALSIHVCTSYSLRALELALSIALSTVITMKWYWLILTRTRPEFRVRYPVV